MNVGLHGRGMIMTIDLQMQRFTTLIKSMGPYELEGYRMTGRCR